MLKIKITDLIKRLEEYLKEKGDIMVCLPDGNDIDLVIIMGNKVMFDSKDALCRACDSKPF